MAMTSSGWDMRDIHEGCEIATTALELVAALRPLVASHKMTDGRMVAFGVETPVELTADQIELLERALWDRIVGRGEV